MRYGGRLLKRLHINDHECVDIVCRQDGHFQFIHRAPCQDRGERAIHFESAIYISGEAAEAAAREKFKL